MSTKWRWRIGVPIFWIVVGIVLGIPDYFRITARGLNVPVLPYAVNFGISYLFWAAITPFVIYLGRKYSFRNHGPALVIAVHALSSLAASAAHTTFHASIGALVWHYMGEWSLPEAWGLFTMPELILYRLPTTTFFYLVILAAGFAFDYQRQLRDREVRTERLEKELVQTELSALRYQLQPHFLFNALHSVVALVRRQENRNAIFVLTSLSDLLRYSLTHIKRQFVPLHEEIAFLEKYTKIEQVRFSDRLSVDIDVSEETEDALVPSFVLQPLVENAIRHGLSRDVRHGEILVAAHREDNRLVLTVQDNGVGLSQPVDPADSSGTGLSATYGRLRSLYAPEFDMIIIDRPEGGVLVTISIPYSTAETRIREEKVRHV